MSSKAVGASIEDYKARVMEPESTIDSGSDSGDEALAFRAGNRAAVSFSEGANQTEANNLNDDIEYLYHLYLGDDLPADYQLKSKSWRIKELVGRIWAQANSNDVESAVPLAVAAEREECAKLMDEIGAIYTKVVGHQQVGSIVGDVEQTLDAASAIRARSDAPQAGTPLTDIYPHGIPASGGGHIYTEPEPVAVNNDTSGVIRSDAPQMKSLVNARFKYQDKIELICNPDDDERVRVGAQGTVIESFEEKGVIIYAVNFDAPNTVLGYYTVMVRDSYCKRAGEDSGK